MTEAHAAISQKVAAFHGYTPEQQVQCKEVGAQYIRELTTTHSKFMSKELMAVGDPSISTPAAPAPQDSQGQTSSEQGRTAMAEPETEEEDWDDGEDWEIPE